MAARAWYETMRRPAPSDAVSDTGGGGGGALVMRAWARLSAKLETATINRRSARRTRVAMGHFTHERARRSPLLCGQAIDQRDIGLHRGLAAEPFFARPRVPL